MIFHRFGLPIFPPRTIIFKNIRTGEEDERGFIREIALLGEEGFARLAAARVAVFGLGGVGSYAAEALVRAGVGALDFVDGTPSRPPT